MQLDGETALARLAAIEAALEDTAGRPAGSLLPFLLGGLVACCALALAAAVGLTWWRRDWQRRRLVAAAAVAGSDDYSLAQLRRLLGDALPAL